MEDVNNVSLEDVINKTVESISRMNISVETTKVACENLKILSEAQKNLSEAEAKLKDVEARTKQAEEALQFEKEKEAQRRKESKRDHDFEKKKEKNRKKEAEDALKAQKAHDMKAVIMAFGDGVLKGASIVAVPLCTHAAIKADKEGDFPCKLALGMIPKLKLPW